MKGLLWHRPIAALWVVMQVYFHAVRCTNFSCGKCDALLDIIDS